jgi:hypothetical protein
MESVGSINVFNGKVRVGKLLGEFGQNISRVKGDHIGGSMPAGIRRVNLNGHRTVRANRVTVFDSKIANNGNRICGGTPGCHHNFVTQSTDSLNLFDHLGRQKAIVVHKSAVDV